MNNREGKGFIHGADYNSEQWLELPEILEEDVALMKKARINEATVGVFAWAALEPEEGRYETGWLQETLDRLHRAGISVILSTPSGARPRWLAERYPEVLRVDGNRQRQLFGGRHNHCYTSPVYREKVAAINGLLAERFGSHPAVIGWHLSNEYGGECHCPLCQEAFREWLRVRYGTVEELNRAWMTAFWSHTYQDFSQVESPSPRGDQLLHGLNLDWRRFVTDQTADFAAWERKSLGESGRRLPVTVNLMYDYKELNYHKLGAVADVVSWDNYPAWHKGPERETALDAGLEHDIMRSIKRRPFLLMESCPSATNWQSVSKLKRPGMLLAASLQAVAHGSDSVQYFQFRQSRGGSEKFHGSVVDHRGGEDSRVFREVAQVGEVLESLGELAGSRVRARAAVIYDWENRWALEDAQGPRNRGLHYRDTVKKVYGALRRLGLDVDVVDMEQELEEYELLAVPMAYMLREGFEERLREFVRMGGSLVMTCWSGVADQTDLCFLGERPHGLTEMLGLYVEEIDALYDGEENCGIAAEENFLGLRGKFQCGNLCELVRLKGARPLAVYGEDFYKGYPAAACHDFGEGLACYVCADFEQSFYERLFQGLAEKKGISCPVREIPKGVEVTSREREGAAYLIVQNFNRETATVRLPLEEYRIIYGEYGGCLKPLGTIVLKKELQDLGGSGSRKIL